MKTFFDPTIAEILLDRLDHLRPEARPRWGRMSCSEMVCHLADAFAGAMGEAGQLQHRWNLFDVPPIRRLLVFTLPWAHSLIPAPEAFRRTSAETWSADIERLKSKMFRFQELDEAPDSSWQVHPLLGHLTTREWGWLAYRHTDYHLRQFGA